MNAGVAGKSDPPDGATQGRENRTHPVTNPDDWDLYLREIVSSYNQSTHASTKFSPFELMYSRKPVLAIQIRTNPALIRSEDGTPSDLPRDEFDTMHAAITSAHSHISSKALENAERARQRNKEDYDRRHEPPTFKVGDQVLVENSRKKSRKGDKLAQPFLGPKCGGTYTVAEVLSKGVVKLKATNTGEVVTTLYNTAKLKRYNARDPVPDPPEPQDTSAATDCDSPSSANAEQGQRAGSASATQASAKTAKVPGKRSRKGSRQANGSQSQRHSGPSTTGPQSAGANASTHTPPTAIVVRSASASAQRVRDYLKPARRSHCGRMRYCRGDYFGSRER